MYVEQKLKVLYSTEKPLRSRREGKIANVIKNIGKRATVNLD